MWILDYIKDIYHKNVNCVMLILTVLLCTLKSKDFLKDVEKRLDTLNIFCLLLVLLLWTLSMYLFALCDLFYISIVFWIWRFQVSFIFRKDFLEVEYFHEVECTGRWFKTMKWKMHFNKIPMMVLKLWSNHLYN